MVLKLNLYKLYKSNKVRVKEKSLGGVVYEIFIEIYSDFL